MNRVIPRATQAQLVHLARAAASSAYCPRSNFHVGASLLANGRFFSGCNIENSSFGMTLCAERSAIFHAVASGAMEIQALAVCCPDVPAGSDPSLRMPCGACRQVIAEFASPDLIVIVDGVGTFSLQELLPHALSLNRAKGVSSAKEPPPMPKPRICIDIDNVVASSDTLIREIIREVTRGRVNLQYEQVVAFDYRECVDQHAQTLRRADLALGVEDEWHQVHDIFSRRVLELAPYPGVQTQLEQLSLHFDLHFATSRLNAARADTVSWLDKHCFPASARLHFLKSGEKHLSLGQFFASVEDELSQAIAFARAGMHSFVLAHPWNQVSEHELVHRCSSWSEISEGLLRLASSF